MKYFARFAEDGILKLDYGEYTLDDEHVFGPLDDYDKVVNAACQNKGRKREDYETSGMMTGDTYWILFHKKPTRGPRAIKYFKPGSRVRFEGSTKSWLVLNKKSSDFSAWEAYETRHIYCADKNGQLERFEEHVKAWPISKNR